MYLPPPNNNNTTAAGNQKEAPFCLCTFIIVAAIRSNATIATELYDMGEQHGFSLSGTRN